MLVVVDSCDISHPLSLSDSAHLGGPLHELDNITQMQRGVALYCLQNHQRLLSCMQAEREKYDGVNFLESKPRLYHSGLTFPWWNSAEMSSMWFYSRLLVHWALVAYSGKQLRNVLFTGFSSFSVLLSPLPQFHILSDKLPALKSLPQLCLWGNLNSALLLKVSCDSVHSLLSACSPFHPPPCREHSYPSFRSLGENFCCLPK